MKTDIKLLIIGVAAALLLAGCSAKAADTEQVSPAPSVQASQTSDAREQTPDSGEMMLGDFNAVTLNGGDFTQDNLADYDLTVVNIWSTTCPNCIQKMPEIAELQKELEDTNSNVQLITYCLDAQINEIASKTILDDAGYIGATLTEADGLFGDLIKTTRYIPTTIFIYGDGELAPGVLVGAQPDLTDAIEEAAQTFLQEKGLELKS